MSIANEINRISTNVEETLNAIEGMGGTVPEGATSNDMAAAARSIPVGAKIDDSAPAADKTYSSQKIEQELTQLNQANAAQDTEIAKKANADDLAAVAKSGDYNDLSNKPTIPTVPTALKNPNKLTFKGAVTAEYDGSSAVEVTIPGGESGGGAGEWELIADVTLDEEVSALKIETDINGKTLNEKELYIKTHCMPKAEETGRSKLECRINYMPGGSFSYGTLIANMTEAVAGSDWRYPLIRCIMVDVKREFSLSTKKGGLRSETTAQSLNSSTAEGDASMHLECVFYNSLSSIVNVYFSGKMGAGSRILVYSKR